MRFFSVTLLLFFIGIASCKKSDLEQTYITFSPAGDVLSVYEDTLQVNLKLFATNGVGSLEVFLWTDVISERKVVSMTFSGDQLMTTDVTLDFATLFDQSTSVYAKYVLTDMQGQSVSYLKRYDLTEETPGNVPLNLYSNREFYSRDNSLFTAFSLDDAEALTPDSLNLSQTDIAEFSNDTVVDPYALSYRWYSPSGCGIVKAPNLNFNTVTAQVLSVTYNASIPMQFTDSLVAGDLYVFRKVTETMTCYYLLQVVEFQSGNLPGRYIFNLKK
jgi:hypothetical protein